METSLLKVKKLIELVERGQRDKEDRAELKYLGLRCHATKNNSKIIQCTKSRNYYVIRDK